MMLTTAAPPWLRRSDQAVTWPRTMLHPGPSVVIDCETTDLPGGDSWQEELSLLHSNSRSALVEPCPKTGPV